MANITTGGNQQMFPLDSGPIMSTPYPAVQGAPNMSQPLPPQLVPLSVNPITGQQFVATTTDPVPGSGTAPVSVVQDIVSQVLNDQGSYMQNARRQGIEMAQARGLRNSSIAAGNSQRAAIEAAMPIVNQAVDITRQREQLGFQGQQAQLDRVQGVNNALLGSELSTRQMTYDYNFRNQLQSNQTTQQDWINNRSFTREFNAALSMMPLNNAYQMNQAVYQYALENPEVYTPEIISGMSNFFQQNMLSILQQYFPQLGGTPA